MTKNKEQQFSNDGRIAALLTFCGFENEKGLSLSLKNYFWDSPIHFFLIGAAVRTKDPISSLRRDIIFINPVLFAVFER